MAGTSYAGPVQDQCPLGSSDQPGVNSPFFLCVPFLFPCDTSQATRSFLTDQLHPLHPPPGYFFAGASPSQEHPLSATSFSLPITTSHLLDQTAVLSSPGSALHKDHKT